MAQGLYRRKQLVGISNSQHAGAANGGIIDVVEAMAWVVATAFEYQDGLVARRGPGGGEKVAGIVQLVHIEQDGAGCAVAGELIQQLAEVYVTVIAEGDEGREAQLMLLGPVQYGGADGGRLGEKGDLARFGRDGREAGVDPLPGQQHAHAVRSQQADAVLLADPLQLPPFLIGKVPCQYDGSPSAFLAERFQQWQDSFPLGADDGEIRHQRQAGNIGIGQHAGDGLVLGGDGKYGSLELPCQQVADDHMTRLELVGGRADHGN